MCSSCPQIWSRPPIFLFLCVLILCVALLTGSLIRFQASNSILDPDVKTVSLPKSVKIQNLCRIRPKCCIHFPNSNSAVNPGQVLRNNFNLMMPFYLISTTQNLTLFSPEMFVLVLSTLISLLVLRAYHFLPK